MPLCSMTGFARVDGAGEGYRWTWELRSVNGKGLDVRLRLPPGFEHARTAGARAHRRAGGARQRAGRRLPLQHDSGRRPRSAINEEVLAEVIAAHASRSASGSTAQPPTLDGILAIRGVVEAAEAEADEATRAALAGGILAGLDARGRRPGRGAPPRGRGDRRRARRTGSTRSSGWPRAAEASPARTPEAIRARLAEQIAALLDAAPALDPDRLHQEAVLLATKADIREELDRLDAHVAAARELLAERAPVGRRLDFLAQEFNREVNTLCSKSNDRALTAIGLDMKAVVDQLREQIQNVE